MVDATGMYWLLFYFPPLRCIRLKANKAHFQIFISLDYCWDTNLTKAYYAISPSCFQGSQYLVDIVNPSNAEATFIQSKRMQRFLKTN